MKNLLRAAMILIGTSIAGPVLADCAADATVDDVRQAFNRAVQREKAGDAVGALGAYVAAQEYTCEPNPVNTLAAARAAALAKPLGDAARARGDHAAAFDFYERGGHFAAADRAMLARIGASPDDVSLYTQALAHVQYRALPAFQANEAARIAVTGAYAPDAGLEAAVAAMPGKAVDRLMATEMAAFDEAWLAKYMALIRERPENLTDLAAIQRFSGRMQALQAGLKHDPLREGARVIDRMRSWESAVRDQELAATLARRRAARADARVLVLTRRYADAPALLTLAIDYLERAVDDSGALAPRAAHIRRQAEALGDAAAGRQQLQLAIDYYAVADADTKLAQTQARQQAVAQAAMQPTIDAMQRDALAMAAQFADPARVAEMQRQAQEAQRALQSGAQGRKVSAKQSADDLAAELGL